MYLYHHRPMTHLNNSSMLIHWKFKFFQIIVYGLNNKYGEMRILQNENLDNIIFTTNGMKNFSKFLHFNLHTIWIINFKTSFIFLKLEKSVKIQFWKYFSVIEFISFSSFFFLLLIPLWVVRLMSAVDRFTKIS